MTVLPPGLIPPPERHRRVVPIDPMPAPALERERPGAHRSVVWTVAFVALVALTLVAVVLAVGDLRAT